MGTGTLSSFFKLFFVIVISTFVLSCSKVNVDLSNSIYENLKIKVTSQSNNNSDISIYRGQNYSLQFEKQDKHIKPILITPIIDYDHTKFNISDVIESIPDKIVLNPDESGFKVNIRIKSTLPAKESFSFSVSFLSADNSLAFDLDKYQFTVNNSIEKPVPISILTPSQGSYVNSINHNVFLISGNCQSVNEIQLTSSSPYAGIFIPLSTVCSGGTFSFTNLDLSLFLDGNLEFNLIQKNQLNEESEKISLELVKDTLAPNLTITNPLNGDVISSNILVVYGNCSEVNQLVSLSGPAVNPNFATCDNNGDWTGSVDISSLLDGVLTFRLTLKDVAGNENLKVLTVNKLTTAPTASLSSKPESYSKNRTLAIQVQGANVDKYKYKLGLNGSLSSCSSAADYSGWISVSSLITDTLVSDAEYRICVLGQNSVAGLSQELLTPTSYTWILDTQPPSIALTLVGGSNVNISNKSAFPVSIDCSEVGQNIEILIGSVTLTTVNCAFTTNTFNLNMSSTPESDYQLSAKIVDLAGNSMTSPTVNIKVDITSPSFGGSISDGVEFYSLTNTPLFSWAPATDSSGISSYALAIGSTPGGSDILNFTDIGNVLLKFYVFSIPVVNGQTYYPSIKARDQAGNWSLAIHGDGWLAKQSSWQEKLYFKPLVTKVSLKYGQAIALSADTMVVGVPNESSDDNQTHNGAFASSDDNLSLSGAVYVYKKGTTAWTQEAFIKPAFAKTNLMFGSSVAIDGDWLVVGAVGDSSDQNNIVYDPVGVIGNANSISSGAVYIYKRTGTSWAFYSYIKPKNNHAYMNFGSSVAISGDTIVVGSIYEKSAEGLVLNGTAVSNDVSLSEAGAVYVYKLSGAVWNQSAYIKPPYPTSNGNFGNSVAIYGDTIVVGSTGESSSQNQVYNGSSPDSSYENSSMGLKSGAAFVYRTNATTWGLEAVLKASNSDQNDNFGVSVSLYKNTIVVGSHLEDSNQSSITSLASTNNSKSNSGAAYVFKRSGSAWTQEAYLKASNSFVDNYFGSVVKVYENTIAVSAVGEKSNQVTIINGENSSTDTTLMNSGAVYVYYFDNQSWHQQAYIKTSNNNSEDVFGFSMDLFNNLLVGASIKEDSSLTGITTSPGADNSKADSGAVYLFSR